MTHLHPTPAGFRELPGYDKPTYNGLVGPIFVKAEEDGGILFGFRAEPRHCNAQDAVHGGMLAGFADIVLTGGTNYLARLQRFVVTISLTTDFLSPAKLGTWVQARPEVLKLGRGTAFSQCLVTADGRPVLRCSGTFHLGGEPDPKYDRLRRFLESKAPAAGGHRPGA